MGELQTLLSQKETLSEQLRRINETCEGIENENNAAKVAALNEEQLKLTAQKRELQTKAASIDRELSDIGGKIQELSGSGVEKILNAIKNQRWFFFKNKPKVIFDRDTGLLWANLEFFQHFKSRNYPYTTLFSLSDISNLINSTNSNGIDTYTKWKIPTPFELFKMIEDKTFPSKQDNQCLYGNWCVYYNEKYRSKRLDYTGATTDIGDDYVYVIPCSAEIQPVDYENNISPNNKIYTEKEKLQFTLNIFVTNELEPIFTDATLTELYRQIYIVKPEVQKELAEVQQQIDALNEVELISPKLDWIALKTKFDVGADSSPIRYAVSLKNLTEYLIQKFDEYVDEKSAVLDELKKISAPPELFPDAKKIRADLKHFHADALTLNKNLTAIDKLENVRFETLPPFALVTELLTEKIRQLLLKVELFEVMPDFVRGACAALNSDGKDGSDFNSVLQLVFVSDDNSAQVSPKEKINTLISELIDYVAEGHLREKSGDLTVAEKMLDKICVYKENLAKSSMSDEDLKSHTLGFVKDMQEIVDVLNDESELLWVRGKIFDFK